MFNVDFNNIVQFFLPPHKRKLKRIEWLKALVKPIIELYNIFMIYRTNTIYSLSFTGQVIYLKKLLNDTYNNGSTGIYITDGTFMLKTYLFHKSEGGAKTYFFNKSENAAKTYLFHKSEYAVTYDFVVMVPSAIYSILQQDNNQGLNNMTALINKYKIAAKRYTIQSY